MATPEIQAPQAFTQAVTGITNTLNVSQGFTYAILNYPAVSIASSNAFVNVVLTNPAQTEVSQALIYAIARGRIANPRLKAWKFKLDKHQFYVLRLGENKTLVVDIETGQWAWWASPQRVTWKANSGINWISSGSVAYNYGSNIVVGDDSIGALWVLNPKQGYDTTMTDEIVPFFRRATAQIVSKGRNFVPVYDVFLTGTSGEPAFSGAEVSLRYSDDGARTFIETPAIVVKENDFVQEFAWRSLGRIQAPGRIFQIEDNGAFARIDRLDVNWLQSDGE